MCVFFLGTALFLSACKKDLVQQQEVNKIDEISLSLENSDIFINSLDSIVNNTMAILNEINKVGGKQLLKEYMMISRQNPSYNDLKEFYVKNNLNDTKLLDLHTRNLANVLFIMSNHNELSSEDANIQSAVFFKISQNLQTNNLKNTKLKKVSTLRYNRLSINKLASSEMPEEPIDPEEPPIDPPGDMDLTWQEVGACALQTVGGAVAGSFKLFKQLHSVITGYNLGWRGIVNVSRSAFQTFAGSNAPGMAIGFAFCIAEKVFFDEDVPEPPINIDTIQWAETGEA